MNRYARRATWEWLTEHWDWLTSNIGSDLSFFRMPIYAGRCFSDLDFLPEFKKFFEAKLTPAFDRPFKQAIEIMEWQAAWKERDLHSLKKFFES
jgi:aminopeptidase N